MKHKFIGIVLVIILSIIPVFLWFLEPLIKFKFATLPDILTSFGQITGLVGMILFSLNLIIAARFRFVEKLFYGLDKAYLKHHLIGAAAFVLLMVHPVFIALKYTLSSSYSAAVFLLPGNNLAVTLGIISLLATMLLLIFTFYFSLKYNVWKWSHKLMGLAFIIGFLHMVLIPSNVSRDIVLRVYMVSFSIFATASYLYKLFYEKYVKGQFTYLIENVQPLGETIDITMTPVGNAISFEPGQFAFFAFKQKGIGEEPHPFSFISGARDSTIRISVKNSGDFTDKVSLLRAGTKVKIEGPYGYFYKHPPKKDQIWIAGGIGIAPFLSMAQSVSKDIKINLFWSVRHEDEKIYIKDIEEAARENSNFHYFFIHTAREGRLTVESISKREPILKNKEIYICGPSQMMKSLREQFVKIGVASGNIHSEEFSL
jgi:predicted ferric reductase